MDTVNKKRHLINGMCKRAFYDPAAFDSYSQPTGAVGSAATAGFLGASAQGDISKMKQVNQHRLAGTQYTMGAVNKPFFEQSKNMLQTGANKAAPALRVAGRAMGPAIGAMYAAGAYGDQRNINAGYQHMGKDTFKNTTQYQLARQSRNDNLSKTGMVAGGAAIGATVGLLGGPVGVGAGALLGAGIGGTAALGMDVYRGVNNWSKKTFSGWDPDQQMYTDHLVTNTQGNAADYAMSLLNRRPGDYMNKGFDNSSHAQSLAASYTADNRTK
jgi:hypothetical protein